MKQKLVYLQCLRDEITSGQRSRNTVVALKITAMAVLVSYSLASVLKIIVFAALIAVVLDYVILGISLMIKDISKYIKEHIEPSFVSFTGWETHISNNPGDVRKGRLLASLASGPGLTIIIIIASFYALFQDSAGLTLKTIENQLFFWIILLLSIVGCAISIKMLIKI